MLSFISVCLSKRSETGRKFGKDFKLSDHFQMAALMPRPVQISEWFLIFSVTALRLCEILQEGILSLKATFTYAWSGCGAETGGFWHSRSATAGMFTHTRSGRRRICHLLRAKMVWSARFQTRRGKLGVRPICCEADFAPALPPLRDRVCVNACNDLCWSQFSALVCSAHVWTYLKESRLKEWHPMPNNTAWRPFHYKDAV